MGSSQTLVQNGRKGQSVRLRLLRLLRIIEMLGSGERHSIQSLVRELRVSRRTIFRDLSLLAEASFPVTYSRERKTYELLNSGPSINTQLSGVEAATAIVCMRMSPLAEPCEDVLRSVARKLLQSIPRPDRGAVEALIDCCLACDPAAQTNKGSIDRTAATLRQLTDAVLAQKKVRITYIPDGRSQTHTTKLSIIRIVSEPEGWIVVGYSTVHRKVHPFNVVEIIQVELTDETDDRQHGAKSRRQTTSTNGRIKRDRQTTTNRYRASTV